MKTVLNPRGGMGETLSLLAVGVILGIAIGTSGCARADKKAKSPVLPPPLPAAQVDWRHNVTGPRQVLVTGQIPQVDERANNLLLQGWRIVPGSAALTANAMGGAAMIALEQRPRKPAP